MSAFTVIVVPNWLVFIALALAVLKIAASLARTHYLRKLARDTPHPTDRRSRAVSERPNG